MPRDPFLFSFIAYSRPIRRQVPPLPPVDAAAGLDATPAARVRAGRLTAGKAARVRALFEQPGLAALAPDPAVRAGLLSLAGTDLEPALDVVLGRLPTTPPFGGAATGVDGGGLLGVRVGSAARGADGRLHAVVLLGPGAPPQLLGAVLGSAILAPTPGRARDLQFVLLGIGWAEMLRDEPGLAATAEPLAGGWGPASPTRSPSGW